MTRVTKYHWTCDRCGVREALESSTRSPYLWLGLLINDIAPDSSIDHNGWKRVHWCRDCRDAFHRFRLRQEDES
jgi:hypothetical protein